MKLECYLCGCKWEDNDMDTYVKCPICGCKELTDDVKLKLTSMIKEY